MKIPVREDEIPTWIDTCFAALDGADDHMIKRLMLAAKAGFASGTFDEEESQSLFEAARGGDADADAALCLIAAKLIDAGETLSPKLSGHVSAVLWSRAGKKPSRKRGRFDPHDYVKRNILGIRLVQAICEDRGLSPTRGDGEMNAADATASAKQSGCSIVAPLIGMTERALSEVWGNRRRYGVE